MGGSRAPQKLDARIRAGQEPNRNTNRHKEGTESTDDATEKQEEAPKKTRNKNKNKRPTGAEGRGEGAEEEEEEGEKRREKTQQGIEGAAIGGGRPPKDSTRVFPVKGAADALCDP